MSQQQVQIAVMLQPVADAGERHKLASIIAAIAYEKAYQMMMPPDDQTPKGTV